MNAQDIKPPYLLTPAHYTNWMPFIPVVTPTGLEVRCRPTPTAGIAVTTTIIALFFIGFGWLLSVKAPGAIGWAFVIGIPTVLGVPFLIILYHESEQRKGPALTYNSVEKTFDLRGRKKIPIQEVASMCVITACDNGGDWLSQLQLHTIRGDRFLVVPVQHPDELKSIVQAISMYAKISVRVFKQINSKKMSPLEEVVQATSQSCC